MGNSINFQHNTTNQSAIYIGNLSYEHKQIIKEVLKNGDIRAHQLEEILKLSRSTVIKYASELVDKELIIKSILPGTEKKYRPTSIYRLNPKISKEVINAALKTGYLDLSKESLSSSMSDSDTSQHQKHEDFQHQLINNSYHQPQLEKVEENNLSPGIVHVATDAKTNAAADNGLQAEILDTESSKQFDVNKRRIFMSDGIDESLSITLDEIYDVFEETIKILTEKIAEQEARIAELEKRLSLFQAARSTKDPREVLRNVRSRFNLESTTILNGKNGNQPR